MEKEEMRLDYETKEIQIKIKDVMRSKRNQSFPVKLQRSLKSNKDASTGGGQERKWKIGTKSKDTRDEHKSLQFENECQPSTKKGKHKHMRRRERRLQNAMCVWQLCVCASVWWWWWCCLTKPVLNVVSVVVIGLSSFTWKRADQLRLGENSVRRQEHSKREWVSGSATSTSTPLTPCRPPPSARVAQAETKTCESSLQKKHVEKCVCAQDDEMTKRTGWQE